MNDLDKAVEILTEITDRKSTNRIYDYIPYGYQVEFHKPET